MSTSSEKKEFLAARQAALQRSLDMVHEAKAERQRVGSQGDWWYDRARACEDVCYRLPKIYRANARRDARALYVSRMPEYALQRAALNWTPSPKWEVTDTKADWGENAWGGSEGWEPTDPAEQDHGY
ncbi:hypothetical protein DFH08DRAFT_974479 [Mycena albidolilacea]|uniref:Uncharacterized protein n=1 Tax=Mycena albidolilacea TaxID=1033008 RepID=A0AAD6Z6V5_9AGAR|nr:hypothetical protein DFH08DRAFT_974479 [Mycena albidolilacea]